MRFIKQQFNTTVNPKQARFLGYCFVAVFFSPWVIGHVMAAQSATNRRFEVILKSGVVVKCSLVTSHVGEDCDDGFDYPIRSIDKYRPIVGK